MRPEEFGPFLSEQRSRQHLTQAELAEKLHVSAAAVSKWERSKCLPELTKLEDIAGVLGISVLEVMNCRLSDGPPPAESAGETPSDTACRSKARRGKRTAKWAAVLMALFICCHWSGIPNGYMMEPEM